MPEVKLKKATIIRETLRSNEGTLRTSTV